ncbi:SRPBCC family protein [Roseovarius ramblicola]|uniref:SRPBCC family protein n=1 Tax=Roseovarius ramblicola TaxID=2022336 RepID=A0ABV5HXP3_9RHOB
MRFENQIDLSVPRDTVFAFVADQRNIPLWNDYVVDVRQESGDGPAVGARYFQTRKTDSQHTEITSMDAGNSLTVETVEGAPVARRHIGFRPTGRGTRLFDSWDLETGYPGVIAFFAVRRIRRAVASNLEKLKHLLEDGEVQRQEGRLVTVNRRADAERSGTGSPKNGSSRNAVWTFLPTGARAAFVCHADIGVSCSGNQDPPPASVTTGPRRSRPIVLK